MNNKSSEYVRGKKFSPNRINVKATTVHHFDNKYGAKIGNYRIRAKNIDSKTKRCKEHIEGNIENNERVLFLQSGNPLNYDANCKNGNEEKTESKEEGKPPLIS